MFLFFKERKIKREKSYLSQLELGALLCLVKLCFDLFFVFWFGIFSEIGQTYILVWKYSNNVVL